MAPLVLLLLLLARVEGLENSARPSCKTCSQSSSDRGSVVNCINGCAAIKKDDCLESSFGDDVPPAPVELQVKGWNKDTVRITWKTNATASGIEFLRGFQIQLNLRSMQEHRPCSQIIIPEGVRLQPTDSELIFQEEVSGLYQEDYDVIVQSLPKSQDRDNGNYLQQTYHYKAQNPKRRRGRADKGCSDANRWRPEKLNVTTVGRQIFIRAKTKTTQRGRINCINQYALYLGKIQGNQKSPAVEDTIYINLTPEESNQEYFNYTISDLSPGNYTLQYAISLKLKFVHDPWRSYPVNVTVQDWKPNNVTTQTNGRNVTVRFDAPPLKYNISKCYVRLFRYDDELDFKSNEFDPNQTVVTVHLWNLPPDTYRVKVSAPFEDAFPFKEKDFSITDWVPNQEDIELVQDSMRPTANSTRLTVFFPKPPPDHDYPSFYVYYGPQTDKLQYMEICQPHDDDRKNVTVQLDVVQSSDLFFQVSPPYPDAARSKLKHFQIPGKVVSPQTWPLPMIGGIVGGFCLILILVIMYVKRMVDKKSASFTGIIKGLIPGRKPSGVPEIKEAKKVLVISTKNPPSHGGPNGAVHHFAKLLQTGLYCDVITELTSQREVDLVGAAQWYIDKIEAADYTVVVCPPNNTGDGEEAQPDPIYTHCVRILGEKLSTDLATQHHKCLTVRFEYSGKHTVPQVLGTARHYKIKARDPDFDDAVVDLFCHFHKFERYQLNPESLTIRIGEQGNDVMACKRNLQAALSRNAAVLGSPEGGDGMGLSVPNTPDQLPRGSSLESLMEGEYAIEGDTQSASLDSVNLDEISQFNNYLDDRYGQLSPTACMYNADACSANVSSLPVHGTEGSTGVAVIGEGGSIADVPTNRTYAHAHHAVEMNSTHIGMGNLGDFEVDDYRTIAGHRADHFQHIEGCVQTSFKTPDQVPQEQSLSFDNTDQVPAFSAHDTGYHSSQNKVEVVSPNFPPYPFRHFPYAGHASYSQRRPLPSEEQSVRHETDTSDANRANGRLHFTEGGHHTAGQYPSLQVGPMVETSPSHATVSSPSRPYLQCPPPGPPSGLPRAESPPLNGGLPKLPPPSSNFNIMDQLSQLNRDSQLRYMEKDSGQSYRETRF
ncbi:uncharacterized protein LOC118416163 [Branchiostoma floridae]|uniref:Uncharacterized protein LOC118416163 n=1 Tax=Branchiostoma floridae TaxID=7739 RepID=A0A9J7MSE9_BRAFL|nr:uncharacterized protein LOC118416163 [Branchiostoma floridae]